MKPTVSIITPVYNVEETISKTIDSVLNQTFTDFEMIIVDDVSTDNTRKIIEKYMKKDNRIKYFLLGEKGGASEARNCAIENSNGRYIAFLDGDDLWKKDKLEKQIKFMKDNNYAFSYTDYEYIDDNDKLLHIKKFSPKKISYFNMLLSNSIGCLTVIYDSKKTGKIRIPMLKKRNDYALWCVILKKVKKGYKVNESLALYRKSNNASSLSGGSKLKLLKYHYQMHRKVNGFNPVLAALLSIINGFNYIINKIFYEKKVGGTK